MQNDYAFCVCNFSCGSGEYIQILAPRATCLGPSSAPTSQTAFSFSKIYLENNILNWTLLEKRVNIYLVLENGLIRTRFFAIFVNRLSNGFILVSRIPGDGNKKIFRIDWKCLNVGALIYHWSDGSATGDRNVSVIFTAEIGKFILSLQNTRESLDWSVYGKWIAEEWCRQFWPTRRERESECRLVSLKKINLCELAVYIAAVVRSNAKRIVRSFN